MGLFSKKENRSAENPKNKLTIESVLELVGFGSRSETGVVVSVDSAMGVPAVWGAVNFLSGTMAGLPLNIYKKGKEGREKVNSNLSAILHDAPNLEASSFEWRKNKFQSVFTKGRAYTLIDRNAKGQVVDLWLLDYEKVTPKLVNGRKKYEYRGDSENKKKVTAIYDAQDIIDIAFSMKADGVSHYSPLSSNKEAIGLSIAATNYGAKFFADGGVPPFVVTGNFKTAAGQKRAGEDFQKAIRNASKERRLALPLPDKHEIKTLGVDPEKAQLVELKKFCNEEIARIYSLPTIFIQDLSKGTFANTEQQDLHLVKHTIKRWVEQFEQEINLKLFGRKKNRIYAEMNLDGLLRGDFKTRMEGYAQGVQNAIIMPSEIREKENLPFVEGSQELLIQGATIPLNTQGKDDERDTTG